MDNGSLGDGRDKGVQSIPLCTPSSSFYPGLKKPGSSYTGLFQGKLQNIIHKERGMRHPGEYRSNWLAEH